MEEINHIKVGKMPRDSKYHQGYFHPRNPEKYIGNPQNIVYRSSWELKFMQWCDRSPNILKYGSEEFCIPYYNPVKQKVCRYFPDFIIEVLESNGKTQKYVIEIKPKNQTVPPIQGKKKSKTYINEVNTYTINQSKWRSIQEWCEDRLIKFRVITEQELGIK
jgi:hypothetical protein